MGELPRVAKKASASNHLPRFAWRARLVLGYVALIFFSGIYAISSPTLGAIIFVVATVLLVYYWRRYNKIYKV